MNLAAGVNVNVRVLNSKSFTGTAGGPNSYLNWVFSSDIWGPRLYLDQVANAKGALEKICQRLSCFFQTVRLCE